ncbi:MAG: mechanosensitive ion channel [Desulfovibrionaceae bacterium]|nr:mechanosensitive ion channel [Desulfovibrionaceae bacterium]
MQIRLKIFFFCFVFLTSTFFYTYSCAAEDTKKNQEAVEVDTEEHVYDEDGAVDENTQKSKKEDEDSKKEDSKAEDDELKKEAVRHAWASQVNMLKSFRESAEELNAKVDEFEAELDKNYARYDDEVRHLIVLAQTYKDWSNPMEAVNRSISSSIADIEAIVAPIEERIKELKRRLERVLPIEENLSKLHVKSGKNNEIEAFAKEVKATRRVIEKVLARYEASLQPFSDMLQRLHDTQAHIAERLPELWKNYYLQSPLPWLSVKTWHNFSRRMQYAIDGLKLRLPVEIPITPDQWRTAGLRFVLCIALSSILGLLMYRAWFRDSHDPAARHLVFVSLPWLLFGASLLVSSVSASGDVFRFFLAIGNLCAILGVTLLAWDLRRMGHDNVPAQASPLLRLMPLTFAAYILLYLPLIRPILLVTWLSLLIVTIVWRFFWPPLSIGSLQLEKFIRSTDAIILWICLILTLAGLHIISLILYLLFSSLSLAAQLSLGGIARINYLNEHLPSQGPQAVFASLLVALAAPLMLIAAFVTVLLWVATLPGGMVLMQEYFFKNVHIGSTQFNLLSILAIISLFFLTRAAVIMGTRFLKRLPVHGLNIDSSLIQPAQTAFTYCAWAFFGLFVLRSLGMELSNLAMVAGGLSVGIGFGMQAIVSNFISGLILIFGRMLQVGDVIEVGGVTGRVCKISVRDTLVETYDNALIYVPNSEFISRQLVNWTRNNPSVRINIQIGVAYGTDPGLVMKTLIAAANANEGVLKYPMPTVAFNDFGDNALQFTLYCWVGKYDARISTATALRLEIEKEFRNAGIEIPFPQIDLHLKNNEEIKAS